MKHLIYFLFTFSLLAQTNDFSIIINKPFNDALLDITEDYDRSISAVGFSRNFQHTKDTQKTYYNAFDYLAHHSETHGSQMHLLKISSQGDVLLSKSATLPRFNEAVAVVKTPQNGYFIGGYTLDGSLIVRKLDSLGNNIFTKEFGTKNYDRMNNLILLSDGGVLTIGSSITSRSTHDAMFETGLGLNDIFLTRFSKDGRKLWSKKYGTKYDDRGIDAVEANDGSIIVISTTSYDRHKNVTLMRITENGNKIWLKHYNNETLTIPHKIIRLRDNNFLALLSQEDTMQKEQIRIIKFDLYKNVLIDKYIHTTYPSALNDIKEFSDGTLLGVGYVKDTYNTDALTMVFNSNLVLLNKEHFGSDNYDVFNAVTILHNSQAAAAGIYTNANSQEGNMWIAKLNKDGTMAQKPQSTPQILVLLQKLFAEEIKKGLISIKEDLTITLTDPSLYFAVGKYKLTQKQKIFLDSFGDKLSSFITKYKTQIKTLEICGHTSSEWGGVDFTQRYLNNSKLSLERSFAVLSYIFARQNHKTQQQLTQLLKGSGVSYSQRVMVANHEDKALSRRVSFKIILK